MIEGKVYFSRMAHVARLMTSFHMLNQCGETRICFLENTDNFREMPHPQIVELESGGKIIAFDMCYAFALNNEKGRTYLSRVDLYFKRSYSREIDRGLSEEELAKIRPYGFDFYTTYPGNLVDSPPTSTPDRLKKTIKRLSGYEKCNYVPAFERKADYKRAGDLKIIF